jgi:ketosteroid isomerase-like protein
MNHGEADAQAERAALFRLDEAWAQAAAAKDVEAILSYWSDDAQVIPPGQPPVIGKEALRRYVSGIAQYPGLLHRLEHDRVRRRRFWRRRLWRGHERRHVPGP